MVFLQECSKAESLGTCKMPPMPTAAETELTEKAYNIQPLPIYGMHALQWVEIFQINTETAEQG